MKGQEEDLPLPGLVDRMLGVGSIVYRPDTSESWAGLCHPDGKLFTAVIRKWPVN
jgi:hypothetical protein